MTDKHIDDHTVPVYETHCHLRIHPTFSTETRRVSTWVYIYTGVHHGILDFYNYLYFYHSILIFAVSYILQSTHNWYKFLLGQYTQMSTEWDPMTYVFFSRTNTWFVRMQTDKAPSPSRNSLPKSWDQPTSTTVRTKLTAFSGSPIANLM
jgi:hypothetical protein